MTGWCSMADGAPTHGRFRTSHQFGNAVDINATTLTEVLYNQAQAKVQAQKAAIARVLKSLGITEVFVPTELMLTTDEWEAEQVDITAEHARDGIIVSLGPPSTAIRQPTPEEPTVKVRKRSEAAKQLWPDAPPTQPVADVPWAPTGRPQRLTEVLKPSGPPWNGVDHGTCKKHELCISPDHQGWADVSGGHMVSEEWLAVYSGDDCPNGPDAQPCVLVSGHPGWCMNAHGSMQDMDNMNDGRKP